ncbi:SGNH/GDSL hydrolase family protein [Kineosporia sp. NBRC 101731]|uniref:SGNH/GDSL hydrolase family protein n=1 Tax=Kineosporia sp. NBRC 101731 TaxID=3032199 RepID=UPI0024A50B1F|nr:SGNH/GDSL hydrolase family protein [Kineosporia sp. NBRC 101731]GLY32100.1 hypothetical protein Kisp02_54650 [Kineosporia sp. NBRC 101731]
MGILDAPGVTRTDLASYTPTTKAGVSSLETQRAGALRPFHAALGGRNSGRVDWLAIGDSISEGASAGASSARYLTRTWNSLRTAFPATGVVGGEGFVPARKGNAAAGNNAVETWSVTAGTVTNDDSIGWGGRSVSFGTGVTLSRTVVGTSLDLWFTGNPSSGTVAVSVDGGAATTIVTAITPVQERTPSRVSLGAAGTHTVTISHSAGGTVYFGGSTGYNGDESAGLVLTEAAHWGWNTTTYSAAIGYFGQRVARLQPSLVTIALLTNDVIANQPSVYKTNLSTLISTIRTNCTISPSIVLTSMFERTDTAPLSPWANYLAALGELEASDPLISWFDWGVRMGPATPNTYGLISADNVHPTAKGHGMMADSLTRFLMPR